ncbi:MAG: thioredoxin family protein [Bacteroidaceae bacterium]|nr:thioredoxin family protein [Bacteroidaceae bacterium]
MKKTMIAAGLLLMVCMAAWAQEGLPRVYDETIDPMVQIEQAVGEAAKTNRFVVCQVGGNWCPWCLRFADFVRNDAAISKVIDENFVYIHVNYNPRKKDNPERAQALMHRLGNPARFGFPVFVVLDEQGRILHTQDSSFLEEGKGYNHDRVLRFFRCWTPKAMED